jgi:hypothetical protein
MSVPLPCTSVSLYARPVSVDVPQNCSQPSDDIARYFTGPHSDTFYSNIHDHEYTGSRRLENSRMGNFLNLFSIVFAAFSGFISGVNLTGEVRNPGGCIRHPFALDQLPKNFSNLSGVGAKPTGYSMPAGMFWAAVTGEPAARKHRKQAPVPRVLPMPSHPRPPFLQEWPSSP